jgi:hypothetical protein
MLSSWLNTFAKYSRPKWTTVQRAVFVRKTASDSPDLQPHALRARQDPGVCLPVHSRSPPARLLVAGPAHAGHVDVVRAGELASEVFASRAITFTLFPLGSHQNLENSPLSLVASLLLRSGRALALEFDLHIRDGREP